VSNFEIVDRRRDKKVEESPVIVAETAAEGADEWDGDIADVVALMPQQDGSMIVMGRSIGIRGDGMPVCADYWFPTVWPKGLDWTKETRKRLDTFLGCSCAARSPCATHRMYLQQWIQQDIQRIRLSQSAPPPRAMEVYILAERAAQASAVVVPR
jgi:hypothetical protein